MARPARWLALWSGVLLACGHGPVEAEGADAAFDRMVAQEMRSANVPGLTYAVVEQGRIARQQAYGSRVAGEAVAMTVDTPMQIGSLSKGITAVAILQLVESGRLALDEPIASVLEMEPGDPLSRVTVRQLLNHTSGLGTLRGNAHTDDLSLDAQALERRARDLWSAPPVAPPGSRWAYSNANYLLLGLLIERASGEDFGSYVDARIFRPLGMGSSWVVGCDCGDARGQAVVGHRPWFGSRRASVGVVSGRASGPQGGVVSTASDMARFLAMLVNGEDDLLSAEGKTLLWQPSGANSPRYGMGWFVDTAGDRAYHGGSSPGFESFAILLPRQRKAAVVLANASSGFGFDETLQLRQSVVSRALGLPYAGERRPWRRQVAFVALLLLPLVLLLDAARSTRRIVAARRAGSLPRSPSWWPMAVCAMLGGVLLVVAPRMSGAYYSTLVVFQPDLALLLLVSAGCCLPWAIARSLAGGRQERVPSRTRRTGAQ